MLQLNKTYKLGKKTFWLFFFKYAKWMVFVSALLAYGLWSSYYGTLAPKADELLNTYASYLPKEMVAMWIALTIFSIMFVGFLRAYVMYRQYKFMLDESAFHVKKGIFMIKQIVIPYHQIQNVEIRQPYLHRFLGLAAIDIIIPSNSPDGRDTTKNLLPVIDKKVAGILAHELIRRGSRGGSHFDDDFEEEEDERPRTRRQAPRRRR